LEGVVEKENLVEYSRPILSTSKVFVSVKPEPKEATRLREPSPRPQPATSKIFAPRTEEMNKGFLMFSDDDSGFTSQWISYVTSSSFVFILY
jgi:hypoxia-inducible factor 1 alpha